MWFGVALLSRFLFAICNVLDSHFVHFAFRSPFSQNLAVALFSAPVSLILFFATGGQLPPPDLWGWIAAAGFLQAFYLIPYFAALKESDSSTVTSLFTLGRAMTPVLAFLLIDETLSVWGYVGFCIVIAGALFHSYVPQHKKINWKLASLMALSGLMVAGYVVTSKPVFEREGILVGFSQIYLLMSFTGLLIYAVPRLRPAIRSDFQKMSKGWGYFALAATVSYAANFFSYYSVSLTKTSYVVLVGQTQPFFVLLIMVIIGRFGFLKTKESFDRSAVMQKLAGFVIMLTGMAVSLLIKP